MTPLQQHMDLMKQELLNMNNNDIRFGYLLKLIRQANELIKAEAETKVSRHPINNLSNIADSHNNFNNH